MTLFCLIIISFFFWSDILFGWAHLVLMGLILSLFQCNCNCYWRQCCRQHHRHSNSSSQADMNGNWIYSVQFAAMQWKQTENERENKTNRAMRACLTCDMRKGDFKCRTQYRILHTKNATYINTIVNVMLLCFFAFQNEHDSMEAKNMCIDFKLCNWIARSIKHTNI